MPIEKNMNPEEGGRGRSELELKAERFYGELTLPRYLELSLVNAARQGDAYGCKFLIRNGVDVNARGIANDTALMHACSQGDVEFSKFLIENGADVNAQENSGFSPLMLAVTAGATEIVKMLLEKGADPNARNSEGNTALIYAKAGALLGMDGYEYMMQLLEGRGATLSKEDEEKVDKNIREAKKEQNEIEALRRDMQDAQEWGEEEHGNGNSGLN